MAELPKGAENLSPKQRRLLELMLKEKAKKKKVARKKATPDTIPLRDPAAPALLSFAQQRLWFIEQFQPGTAAYNIPSGVRLEGPLNADLFARAAHAVALRHETLRTTFALEGQQPVQKIDPGYDGNLPVIDLTHLPEEHRQQTAQDLIDHLARSPFDLAAAPAWRLYLLRLAPEEHIFLVVMHHILSDTWTTGVFFREMVGHYQHFSDGGPLKVPDLPVQYADYAVWQRRALETERLKQQVSYWKHQFEDAPPLLELPTDRPRPAVQTFRGGRVALHLPRTLTDRLRQLAGQHEGTLFMAFMAGLQTLLFRYSQQADVLVGTPMANRKRVELENLVGLFVNTLVLRTRFHGDPPFEDLFRQMRETTLEGLSNHDVPFEKVVEELDLERDTSRNPLFQVIFAFQNVPIPKLVAEGLTLERYEFRESTARLDLELDLQEMPDGFVGWMGYNSDLFDHTTALRMVSAFRRLLQSIVDDPQQRVSRLPLLGEGEHHQVLTAWNDAQAPWPAESSLGELFLEVAAERPEATALLWDEEHLTYGTLARCAGALATELRQRGIGPEVGVGLAAGRSAEAVIAILGTVLAGGFYVPLDIGLPEERLQYMLEDASTPVVLATAAGRKALGDTSMEILDLEPFASPVSATEAPTPTPVSAHNLVYTCYTSGSTGQPKGVSVPHRGVVRLVRGNHYVDFDPHQTFLLLTPLSFDVSAFEFWGALLSGARLAIYGPRPVALSDLGNTIAGQRVSVLWLSSGLFHLMVEERSEDLAGVRQLVAGGDVVAPNRVRRQLESGQMVINGYGPTENTTFSTSYRMERQEDVRSPTPIGRPIANSSAHVVDARLGAVPLGVAGELVLGGEGLARGYLGRPAFTAQRFVPAPHGDVPGARWYRSGDRARFLIDGRIEFLGRVDHQVKIRGFRVELGEIEALLGSQPGVAECVVLLRGDSAQKMLVAYVVPEAGETAQVAAWREVLGRQLPEYMVPAAFMVLDELPVTTNGKVDRRALPAPERPAAAPAAAPAAPTGELEGRLAELWARVLGMDRVGRDENFFEIGGNSLLMAQVHHELETTVAPGITLVELFQYPTVAKLAEFLGGGEDAAARARDALSQAAASRLEGVEGARDDIAIIGLGLRFPEAETPDEYWQNLVNGVHSVCPFSREDALAAGVSASMVDHPDYILAEGSIDHLEAFDYQFFGYKTLEEVEGIDPQQRIFLENVWEALESGGYDPETYDGTIGIVGGANISSYLFSNLYENDPLNIMSHFLSRIELLSGNQGDFLCTRISYLLGLEGPSLTVQTACSTTLVAVHQACQTLLRHECDLCLTGGVQIRVPQRMGYMYQEGGFPSPDGYCRSFDAKAQGNVHGNGSGVLLLKRRSDAIRDGDHIYAVIKGSAALNDGSAKVGYNAPGVGGQARTAAQALAVSGVPAESIGYLEAAGTAAELGDPIEIEALTRAYRLQTDAKGFCPIGSVKSNIGHLDVASGAAALIKTALVLDREAIPPSLHFEEPNPQINFDDSPFFVNTELRPWPRGEEPRRAAVHAYAVGGTNAHLVLEEGPVAPEPAPSRAWHLLPLSARTPGALERATANLGDYLARHPELHLADASFTLGVGRRDFTHRRFVLCRALDDAQAQLTQPAARNAGEAPRTAPEVAFLLRGTPDVHAARALFHSEPAFRQAVEACAASSPAVGSFFQGDSGEATSEVTFAVLFGLSQLFQEWGVAPKTVAGTGPGERVALHLAGVLSLNDALNLPSGAEWKTPERAVLLADGTRVETGEILEPEDWQGHLGASEGDTALAELLEQPGQVLLEPGLDNGREPEDVIASLLGELGRLWVAGVDVDWSALWRHETRRRTPLPTYPFERTRVWAEPKTDWADAFSRRADPDLRQDLDDWFRAPSWQRQEVVPGEELALPAGPWLLLVDDDSLGADLAQALRERTGEPVFEVAQGAETQRSGERFTVRSGHSQDLEQVFETLESEGTGPAQIVSLWGLDELPEDASPLAHPEEFTALLPLARTLGRLAVAPQLVVVTAGAEEITGAEALHPARAVVRGLLQVLPKEVPGVRCRHLDVEPPRGSRKPFLEALLRELAADEPRSALRGRHRWVETWQRLPLSDREPTLREGGVYLLVGPLDDFALLAADLLTQGGKTRLAVIGESGLPPVDGWAAWVEQHPPEDDVRRRIEALQTLEARGAELMLLDTDPTREAPLRAAVARVRERFGAIHGVVHAAPERAPEFARSLAEVDLDFYQYRLRLRLGAVLALADLLADDELDFHILPATLGPLLGGSLTGVDSAADAFLDAFAHHQSQLGRRITSIDWDVFADPDAGDEAPPLALRAEEGREVLRRVLANPGPAQVLVSTADLEARLDVSRQALDAVEVHEPLEPGERRPRPDLENPFVAPRSEAEEDIAELWAEVLELETVGVEDNFFDLGGNSLLATRLVTRLREHFGIELGLGDFFEEATVARVARAVESQNWARQASDAELVAVGDDEELGEI